MMAPVLVVDLATKIHSKSNGTRLADRDTRYIRTSDALFLRGIRLEI